MINNFITLYWSDFIFHEIIFATILFLILWPITHLFRNKSPHWKYYLWTLLFIRLILPNDFSLPGNIWQFAQDFDFFNWITISNESNILSAFENDLSLQKGPIIHPANSTNGKLQNVFDRLLLLKIVFILWLCGFSIMLYLFYRKKQQYKHIILNSRLIQEIKIHTTSQTWKDVFGIKRVVRIYASDKYLSPFTIGIIQPRIFIPEAIFDTNDQILLNSIIGHEMAHIKRFDAIWTQMQFLIQAFFFFYPIVWFTSRQLNIAREGICDQMVLQKKQIPSKQYAQSVIQILRLNSVGSIDWPYAPALRGSKQSLKLRINQIMGNNIMNKKQIITLAVIVGLLGFTTIPMASILNDKNDKGDQAVYPKDNLKQDDFLLPIKTGKVASGFGQRMHPFKKVVMHHNGIDIAAPKGVEVYAIADGVVEFADSTSGYGNKVILIHENSYSSYYGQLSEILVKKGMSIKAGQLIGLVGNSGRATAPHLHFELRENNKPLNPEDLIDFSNLQLVK